ncbi:hypothetical protein [Oceanicoccus sp. KOV_DT_Chl]|uniref:hypothetical protein n=1 Tax=Oceanicoccus sp. KOV_DT_Chl TaxID=1904639 RepID=UPI001F36955D|nr:hypothetical protein [Oceanicoccus sp. KOV_DT_Chl]
MKVGIRSVTVVFVIASWLVMAAEAVAQSLYSDAANYARTSENAAGAVATVHPLATQAGLNMLEKGVMPSMLQ